MSGRGGVVLRGREAELAVLLGVLMESARTGEGVLVAVSGEPGIGKSSLLRAVADEATQLGFRVGTGKADQVDQVAPGTPLLVALRSGPRPVLDDTEFSSLASVYDRQLWLVDRLAAILEDIATHTPVLISIDDVQWVDALTRFALRVLPGRLAASPVAWLLMSRLVGIDAVEEVVAAADGVLPVVRVSLDRLTAGHIDELVLDRLGAAPDPAVQDLLRGVGGNPFWAVQVLEGLAWRRSHGLAEQGMHAELMDGARRRLSPLDPETVDLVGLAAVWGRALPVGPASDLLGIGTAGVILAARQAEDNGLLTSAGGEVDFSHDLVRAAAYAVVPAKQRVALHRACGRYLLANDASAFAAAPHFRAVAVPGDLEAAAALERAGFDSAATMPDQAAQLAQEAFALVPPSDPLWLPMGQRILALLVRVQRVRAVVAIADRLLARTVRAVVAIADRLLARTSESDAVALLQVESCRALWAMGDCREVERRVKLTLRSTDVSDVARARLSALGALASIRTENAPTAVATATAALQAGRDVGDDLAQRIALHALTEAGRNEGRHEAALDPFAELRSFAGSEYLAEEIRVLQHLDRYAEADVLLDQARDEVNDDVDKVLPSLLYAQMWQDHNLGRLDAAEAGARTLLRLSIEIGSFVFEMNARMVLSGVSIYRGNLVEARVALQPVEEREESRDELRVARLRLSQAWLASMEGDLARAVTILRPLLVAAPSGTQAWAWSPPWMRVFAGVGIAAGDRELAAAAAHVAELGAERNPAVRSMEGVALQIRGVVDNDPDLLAEAVRVLEDAPRPMLYAQALADLGAVLIASGHRSSGTARLSESAALFESLGAVPAALAGVPQPDRVRSGRGSVPRQGRPSHGLAALTNTERRVAELIAAGQSSRVAAAELFVSPNTVNTHLRSIFTKLDVRSRVQLVNLLRDQAPEKTQPARR
jgi:DNA-binding CsgD family transcriptional regulator/tetratricopeptide (TPR) repeat protein